MFLLLSTMLLNHWVQVSSPNLSHGCGKMDSAIAIILPVTLGSVVVNMSVSRVMADP